MNTPARRLATVVIAMFLALMGGATWVQFFQAPTLNNDNRNVRTLYREFGNARGPIVVGGESIASSTAVDDPFGYQRSYANGALYAPVTGFYSIVFSRSGIEDAMNTELNGTADSLFYNRLQDLITGRQPQGAIVELTIDPVIQQAAWDALGDQRGAVVALDPRTGAILAMVSKPSFDPNLLASHDTAAVNEAWAALNADEGDPMVNRAIAGTTYPPGSTFKLVTAAAALEAGMTPATQIAAPDVLDLPQSSATLGNFGGSSCSPTGTATLLDALRISCNTAFGQLGMDLGADALREQAEAFGFDTPLDVPLTVTESHFPDAEAIDAPQTAIAAIGQYDVRVTPLQMAMVSAAIANGGEQMAPYLVAAVRSADLTVVDQAAPSTLGRPVSAATAAALRDMMVAVVASGTGTSAQISGVTVAGKTGTAQTTADAAPHAWFTAFAPAENPTIAIAVIVENGGSAGSEATGGRVAAPVARAVIEAALR
ncbi:penicillin-binding transpeptidase domain-containing protein [Actinotalea sp.]|uniref:peptidoglycan D,D-transpeptidase FtsI family protein n=1 Tax=Actinotalea sp. TaxID=1872145 RepID=UPI002C753799|nr:penicillin-binding transpeptidase domain-containing protein [Actinotalea sp.]HRA50356.1 penicillin-binding transpeptidase domain-containing protein [Actinotalea sp.]